MATITKLSDVRYRNFKRYWHVDALRWENYSNTYCVLVGIEVSHSGVVRISLSIFLYLKFCLNTETNQPYEMLMILFSYR
jgi:hypothetical protein